MRFRSFTVFPIILSFLFTLQLSEVAYSRQPGMLESPAVPGGSVTGTVKSGDRPVVGATVRLLGLDRATYTDAKGEFFFPDVPNGEYNVFVRCIGYTSGAKRVDVENNSAMVFFLLRQSAIRSEGVVVSASPYARPADKQYQPAESMSREQLHNNPGASFAQEIADMPGVSVRYNGAAPARPMVRGLSDNEVLVLQDGLRTGDVSTYDPAHAVPILPLSIAQIDVVRGPASIMFGPNAIGGLINIITNTVPTASTKPFTGTVSLAGNTVSDLYSGYFDGVYSSGGSAFSVSAGGSHSQDTRIPQGSYFDGIKSFELSRMPQSFAHTQQEGAGYSYQGDFGMIGVGYRHFEMTYGIPGTPPNSDWLIDPPTTSLIEQKKNLAEMRGLWAVEGSLVRQVRLNADFVDYDHSEYPTAQDSTGVSNPQANFFHKQTFNATLQLMHQQFGALRGTVGLWSEIDNLKIEGDQPLGPNSITTGFAGYIYEEYLLNADTRFQGAIRYDYNNIRTQPYPASQDPVFQTLDVSRSHNALTASLGAVQELSNGMAASLSLARSFRAPTVQELFAQGADAASNTYSIGNPSLAPETAFGIDASLKGHFTSMSFELTPYVNFISNYIYAYLRGDTIENLPVRQFSATDARLFGFEATATVEPVKNVALEASASYVNAQDTKNNEPLPFIPPLHGFLKVTYQDN
ncbi:MAG TPA: TonB-dependent receptor, partial [Candidatus Kryptobacter bacterium]|nr:TonB-dependent receptor [Candidatus Kryptobacter bacterium]